MASSCRFSTVSGERRRPSSSSSVASSVEGSRTAPLTYEWGFPYALHSRRASDWAPSKLKFFQLRSSTLLPCLFFPSAALKVLEQLIGLVEHDFLPYALHSRGTRLSAILKLRRSHLDARISPSCIARSVSPRTSSLCLVRGRVPKVLEQLTGYIEHLLMENIASFLALCTPLYVAIGHSAECSPLMLRRSSRGLMYAWSLSLRYLLDAPVPAPMKILVNKALDAPARLRSDRAEADSSSAAEADTSSAAEADSSSAAKADSSTALKPTHRARQGTCDKPLKAVLSVAQPFEVGLPAANYTTPSVSRTMRRVPRGRRAKSLADDTPSFS
ncbi:hypothetical protein EV714DRAFT_278154 [Schizophyllum commune]